jgi:hydroxyacylglutathione hydrolase
VLLMTMALGPIETNCHIVAAEEGRRAAVIDPADDAQAILEAARANRLEISHILLTHGHFDHVLGVAELKRLTGAPVGIHAGDAAMLTAGKLCGAALLGIPYAPCEADWLIEDGARIEVDGLGLTALHTPGHTPGGLSFLTDPGDDSVQVVFTGDALFRDGIGRTDLPGGDTELLLRSICERLGTLAWETRVLPGHGPATDIGRELRSNPFLQGRWPDGACGKGLQ